MFGVARLAAAGLVGLDGVDVFAGEADAAAEGVGDAAAGVGAELEEGGLVFAGDHVSGGVGGVVDLLEVVGGVHVEVGGVGGHLPAGFGRGGDVGVEDAAEVFVVFEEDALVEGADEVTGGDGRETGLLDPLFEIGGEGGWEFAHGEGIGLELFGEDGDGGGGLAVAGMEIEGAEDDAVLEIDPDEGAAFGMRGEAGGLAGGGEVAAFAEGDGLAGIAERVVHGVGDGHVGAVVEGPAGESRFDELLELLVVEEVFGWGSVELLEEGELVGRDGVLEDGFVVRGEGRLLGEG